MEIMEKARLCFGTFVNVLGCCKKNKADKKQVVGTIIKIIDKNTMYIERGTAVNEALSRLYVCKNEISLSNDYPDNDIISVADSVNEEVMVQGFENEVFRYIDQDKKKQAVLALCDIIRNDVTLDNEKDGTNIEKFQYYFGKSPKEILDDNEYVLSVFLAKIFRYTVIAIKNNDGIDWIEKMGPGWKQFFIDYVNGFAKSKEKDLITVWNTVAEKVKNDNMPQNEAKPKKEFTLPDETPSEQMRNIFKQFFHGYRMAEFLDIDTSFKEIPQDMIFCINKFIEEIEREVARRILDDNNKMIYIKIQQFTNILHEYIECISESEIYASRSDPFGLSKEHEYAIGPTLTELIGPTEGEYLFFRLPVNRREQLATLFKEICGDSTE